MQVEPIADLNGKIVSRRVLDVDAPTMESTAEAKGKYKEAEVIETVTFLVIPQPEKKLRATVRGIILTKEEDEVVTYKGDAVGIINSSEEYTLWRGSVIYNTSTGGKLAFLNNASGLFEAKIDSNQNFSERVWERK